MGFSAGFARFSTAPALHCPRMGFSGAFTATGLRSSNGFRRFPLLGLRLLSCCNLFSYSCAAFDPLPMAAASFMPDTENEAARSNSDRRAVKSHGGRHVLGARSHAMSSARRSSIWYDHRMPPCPFHSCRTRLPHHASRILLHTRRSDHLRSVDLKLFRLTRSHAANSFFCKRCK